MGAAMNDRLAAGGNELLGKIIDGAVDFAIIALDTRGMVTGFNAGAARLLGYRPREIVGRSGDRLYTEDDRRADVPRAERRTALAGGRSKSERWFVRKDGTRLWALGVLTPIRGPTRGFIQILHDLGDRLEAEERLRQSEPCFRMLATNIPQLVFRARASGDRTWGSPQWTGFTGLTDEASRELGWLEAVHPEDRDATLAAWREAPKRGDYCVEHRIRRAADSEYRWHQTRARPRPDDPAEWVGASTDVHDLRMMQDRQKILLAELQHRTRNLLAVVLSLTRRTLRASSSVEAFGQRFESRLQSLSRVQGLLARTAGVTLDLRALIEAELAAHVERDVSEVQIAGPPVPLPTISAQTLALALHELATNAVKYGALRQPPGQLAIAWQIEEDEGRRRVVLDWRETGVAMPAELPARRGYGSELIERALPYQLKAKTSLHFAADGVRCSIAVPLDETGGGSS